MCRNSEPNASQDSQLAPRDCDDDDLKQIVHNPMIMRF